MQGTDALAKGTCTIPWHAWATSLVVTGLLTIFMPRNSVF